MPHTKQAYSQLRTGNVRLARRNEDEIHWQTKTRRIQSRAVCSALNIVYVNSFETGPLTLTRWYSFRRLGFAMAWPLQSPLKLAQNWPHSECNGCVMCSGSNRMVGNWQRPLKWSERCCSREHMYLIIILWCNPFLLGAFDT